LSYDRQLDQVCPHQVAEEALFVSTDQRTVSPMQPVASISSVMMRFDGEIMVPSTGVLLPATATGSKDGPFNISTGVNDILAVKVDQGPLQTATIAPALSISTARLAAQLNAQLTGVTFVASGTRMTFRTASEGQGSSLFIDPSSTMAPLLGFIAPRYFRGQTVVPGWTLVRDVNSLTNPPLRLIVFDRPLRGMRDFVEITYTTTRQNCRRCGGTGTENDWRYGRTGEVIQVRDEALLEQEILKLLLTLRGSNPFPNMAFYGTTISEAIGKKLTAGGQVQNLLVSDVITTFKMWQDVKRKQEQLIGQFVSDEEYPYRLLNTSLLPSKDPTIVFLSVTVQNRSQKPIVLERGLKLPAGFDITSFQQGLIRQNLRNPVLVG